MQGAICQISPAGVGSLYQHAKRGFFYERPGRVAISPAGVGPRRQIAPWLYVVEYTGNC
jgi:hypothetical protein